MENEDEECLPENSGLITYLQKLGYFDVEVKEAPPISNIIKLDFTTQNLKKVCVEYIDKDVIEQIQILISTQMLFEEDVATIEKLLTVFKIKKNGMLKSMFQGTFGITIVFIGLLFYWVMGSYTFFIISTFYAYKAADYLWKKHYNQRRLKKLAVILQSNCVLLNKAFKFIKENDRYVNSDEYFIDEISDDLKAGFSVFNNFKIDFLNAVNEMISVLTKATDKLIEKLPLYDYAENPQYYLCKNFSPDYYNSCDLFKLYKIYLLVQSEFLQRLILSLIPNLNLSKVDNFQSTNKILTESCVYLLKIKNNLSRKFKFIFLNGIHNFKPKVQLKMPTVSKDLTESYKDEFVSNIHDASNTFQNLLIRSRILEENFKGKIITKDLENELNDMQNDLNSCQKSISNSVILLKKASAAAGSEVTKRSEDCQTHIKSAAEPDDREISEKILVGYSDLDPNIEDEIFEAYISEAQFEADKSNLDEWDIEDKLQKKLQKEYSKNVMKELKTKIVERAKKWEEKEVKLLGKKMGENKNTQDNSHEPTLDTKPSDNEINSDGDILPPFEISRDSYKNHKAEQDACFQGVQNKEDCSEPFEESKKSVFRMKNNEKLNLPEQIKEDEQNGNDIYFNDGVQMTDTKFLSDLNIARQKIFNTNMVKEELFYCDSDENSD